MKKFLLLFTIATTLFFFQSLGAVKIGDTVCQHWPNQPERDAEEGKVLGFNKNGFCIFQTSHGKITTDPNYLIVIKGSKKKRRQS